MSGNKIKVSPSIEDIHTYIQLGIFVNPGIYRQSFALQQR